MALRQMQDGLSQRQAAQRFVEAIERTDPEGNGPDADNLRRLAWRESLPALAMTLALPLHVRSDTERRTVRDLLLGGNDWVPVAVDDAQRLIPHIADSFQLKYLLRPTI